MSVGLHDLDRVFMQSVTSALRRLGHHVCVPMQLRAARTGVNSLAWFLNKEDRKRVRIFVCLDSAGNNTT